MITAALGIAFAGLHIREWLGLIDEGMTLFHNPWGTGLFGASFFSITGLHLTHVMGGVIALVAVGSDTWAAVTMPTISRLPASTGTLSISSGCSSYRSSIFSTSAVKNGPLQFGSKSMAMTQGHTSSVGKYVGIYLVILVIAALQFVVAYSNISSSQMLTRMFILATIEAAIALLFFMHLADNKPLMWFVVIFTVAVILGMQYGWTDSNRIANGVQWAK